MKKVVCWMLAGLLVILTIGSAMAERDVNLPESGYKVIVPDELSFSGKGKTPDTADFAWVSEKLGLEVEFLHAANEHGATLEAMATVLQDEGYDAEIRDVSGILMIVYEGTDPGDDPAAAMKFITYVFLEGNMAQQICFWYANQEAADLTAQIIESITNKD